MEDLKKCKYVECDKMIPAQGQRNYCDDECYKKQNRLDQAVHREIRRQNRQIVMVECAYEKCNKKFQFKARKQFCDKTCRDGQNDLKRERRIKDAKESAERSKGDEGWKKFTERGKIHYEGYSGKV